MNRDNRGPAPVGPRLSFSLPLRLVLWPVVIVVDACLRAGERRRRKRLRLAVEAAQRRDAGLV